MLRKQISFDALEEADRMVYVEKHHLRAQASDDREFVDGVSRAMQVAGVLLNSQKDAQKRARAGLLVDEVMSRFVGPGLSEHSGAD